MSNATEEPFLSRPRNVDEIAEYIGSTKQFVASQIRSGRLRAIKLSPKILRVMPSDLRDWLENGATRPKKAKPQEPVAV